MAQDLHRGSAKIYQFAARGRAGLGVRAEDVKPAADFASPHFAKVACGSAWYHEAAIEQAERPRK
jgi:hypothetical protein